MVPEYIRPLLLVTRRCELRTNNLPIHARSSTTPSHRRDRQNSSTLSWKISRVTSHADVMSPPVKVSHTAVVAIEHDHRVIQLTAEVDGKALNTARSIIC